MAITNYTDLQSTIADWLHRDDLESAIPTFIQLAEKQMSRQLRLKNQETEVTGTASTTIALPSDYVEMISLTLTIGGMAYPLIQRDRFSATVLGNNSSGTQYYTIEGSNIILAPQVGTTATYTLQYFASVPALSDAEPTNWLITAHPDLYLYGCLVQAAPYMMDDPRVQVWGQFYGGIKDDIIMQDQNDRSSGSPRAARAQMSCW